MSDKISEALDHIQYEYWEKAALELAITKGSIFPDEEPNEWQVRHAIFNMFIEELQPLAPADIWTARFNHMHKEMSYLLDSDCNSKTHLLKELDDIWNAVRPDPFEWDYVAQITRYVKDQASELETAQSEIKILQDRLAGYINRDHQ